MKRSRSILSMLLAFSLVFTMSGMPAFADEGVGTPAETVASGKGTDSNTGDDLATSPDSTDASSVDPEATGEPKDGTQSDDENAEGKDSDKESSLDAQAEESAPTLSSSLVGDGERAIRVVFTQGATPVDTLKPYVEIFNTAYSIVSSGSITVKESSNNVRQGSYVFRGLADGTYSVSVSADGFVKYTQDVILSGFDASISVGTSKANYNGTSHAGTMIYGDVVGDGSIGDSDILAIVEAIENPSAANKNYNLDLCNSDGSDEVNLLDLQVLAEAINEYKVSQSPEHKAEYISTETKLTSVSSISLGENSAVEVVGGATVADLLNGTPEEAVIQWGRGGWVSRSHGSRLKPRH